MGALTVQTDGCDTADKQRLGTNMEQSFLCKIWKFDNLKILKIKKKKNQTMKIWIL